MIGLKPKDFGVLVDTRFMVVGAVCVEWLPPKMILLRPSE